MVKDKLLENKKEDFFTEIKIGLRKEEILPSKTSSLKCRPHGITSIDSPIHKAGIFPCQEQSNLSHFIRLAYTRIDSQSGMIPAHSERTDIGHGAADIGFNAARCNRIAADAFIRT